MRLLNILLVFVSLSSCDFPDSNVKAEFIAPSFLSNYSYSPYMSKDFNGRPLMSWIDKEADLSLLKYSVWEKGHWSKPVLVSQGENWLINRADFPSVVQMSEDTWLAHWLVFTSEEAFAYDVLVSISRDGGKTWSEGTSPHDDGTISEHGFVSFFKDKDDIGIVWLDGREMPLGGHHHKPAQSGYTGGMTLRSAKISADNEYVEGAVIDNLVCDCCQTDIAQLADGPVLVYRNRTEEEYRDIYFAKMMDGVWQKESPVLEDNWQIGGCPVNGPSVNAVDDKFFVVWFTQANGYGEVKFKAFEGNGTSKLAIIDNGNLVMGNVNSSMVSNEQLAVSWLTASEEDRILLNLGLIDLKSSSIKKIVIDEFDSNQRLSVPQVVYSDESLFLSLSKFTDKKHNLYASKIDISVFDTRVLSDIEWVKDEI